MKIALFTGTAYRHLYYAAAVGRTGAVVLHVKTKRSQELADEVSDSAYAPSDRALLKAHSDLRTEKEREYFGTAAEEMPDVPSLEVEMQQLNTPKVLEAFRASAADIVLVYGTGLLKRELLSAMPEWVINLHAGLSPYYRGAATLYWPLYFMSPQYVGYTLHLIDEHIDHGAIIHQNRPAISAGDTIHDLGCRTIVTAASDIVRLLPKIAAGDIRLHEPTSKGKIFSESDFKPYHLRVTDFLMKNGLLKEYVENRGLFPEPKVIQQDGV